MKILICGAAGFIGRHLEQTLQQAGHQVWHGARAPTGPFSVAMDFNQDQDSTIWRARVRGMDVVINAVGILSGSADDFARLHTRAPIALFEACKQAGVKRFVQISALANGTGLPPFLASKHAFDAHILAAEDATPDPAPVPARDTPQNSAPTTLTRYCETPMHSLIVRPSLVVGVDGASSQWFRSLASMPLLMLPGRGEQQLQPVHVNDLCCAIKHWIEQAQTGSRILNAVGPKAISYRAMLARYRNEMGLPAAPGLNMPVPVMQAMSAIVRPLLYLVRRLAPGRPARPGMLEAAFSADNLAMLNANNTADPAPFARLLGRMQQHRWFPDLPADYLRQQAIAGWAHPLQRIALALLWWITALVSGALYPVEGSLALLAPLHLPHGFALLCLYGASLLDFSFGLATLLWPTRRLWWWQILLILGYTAVISVTLPAFWLHPFGPVLKNLPILALLFMLLAQETRK